MCIPTDLETFSGSGGIETHNLQVTILSQLDKCLKFKSVRGRGQNDCTLYKMTPENFINFRHLCSCDTVVHLTTLPSRLGAVRERIPLYAHRRHL